MSALLRAGRPTDRRGVADRERFGSACKRDEPLAAAGPVDLAVA